MIKLCVKFLSLLVVEPGGDDGFASDTSDVGRDQEYSFPGNDGEQPLETDAGNVG